MKTLAFIALVIWAFVVVFLCAFLAVLSRPVGPRGTAIACGCGGSIRKAPDSRVELACDRCPKRWKLTRTR